MIRKTLFGLVCVSVWGLALPAFAQADANLLRSTAPDRSAKLAAAAKVEGALTLYTSIAEKDLKPLIEPFEKDGTLVKRDRTEIERDIDHYTIIDHDGVIFACAALYPYPEAKTAEMAALTVSPQSQGQGDGDGH